MSHQPPHSQPSRWIARAKKALRRFVGSFSGWTRGGRYQPEKHYMRGPGPKSLNKSGDREADPEQQTHQGRRPN